ncbi:choline ABC transporter substrate-binding protein [Rubellimicrobium sp. CFH 75288]|uniref:choline ABC transporter substrate-binding protein n=1 Tax=Rubellimicrobium sp. CFH 75288 TaxID=2697034 RepID=UPI00145092F4|nr:choline ABC transporter substrate-binding protein [Rubellimicrobium sp. CFH 75288]NAZ37810.1 choline ABC transporter substrate-binding protein [Rubellimicrobium sp. CFH 75288]
MMRPTILLAALGLAGAAAAADPEACATPRFADIGWTDIQATTALAGVVLEGLGYRPETVMVSIPIAYASMRSGDIDVFLGDWQPSLAADRQPYLDDGSVEVLGVNLEGAKYTLATLAPTAEAGLRDFADIARHGEALGFRIHGIEPGNDGNRIIQTLIDEDRFGLGGFQLVESSEQGMLSQVARLAARDEAVVFLAWAPHPMNARFPIVYLSGGDEWFGPDYGGATVHTNARAGLAAECPELGRFLRQLRFTLEMENAVMGRILDDGLPPAEAARDWLVAHPETLAPWLEGITARDGRPGLAAVRAQLGLPPEG